MNFITKSVFYTMELVLISYDSLNLKGLYVSRNVLFALKIPFFKSCIKTNNLLIPTQPLDVKRRLDLKKSDIILETEII